MPREPQKPAEDRIAVEQLCLPRVGDDTTADSPPLPRALAHQLRRVLGHGVPCTGHVHLHCPGCGTKVKLGFRCGAGCPVCGRAARGHHLMRLIPRVPVRHWVLSLPGGLRHRLAADATLARAIGRSFVAVVFEWLREKARNDLGLAGRLDCGCVTVLQRSGAALDVNVHVHALVLDGVYEVDVGSDEPVFYPCPEPGEDDVARIVGQARRRILQLVDRHGSPTNESQAQIAHRPAAGPVVEKKVVMATDRRRSIRAARSEGGFGVHAGRSVAPTRRSLLRKLCDYVTRPLLDVEALAPTPSGRVRYRLKEPFHDGTTHVEFEPGELVHRLMAMVPTGPLSHVSYHGALAPNAAIRWQVIPGPQQRSLLPDMLRPHKHVRPAEPTAKDEPDAAICARCGTGLLIVGVEESAQAARLDEAG